MPRQIEDIKTFIGICRRPDAQSARVKKIKSGKVETYKIKVRCEKYLYTIVLKDAAKAEKLKQSLPPNLTISDIPNKNAKGKHVA